MNLLSLKHIIRRPSFIEICIFCSWALLALTATIMGASTRAWLAFLWAMYGNRNWPFLTEIYLNSVHWFWVIPFLSGTIVAVLWVRTILDRASSILHVLFHAASLAIFVFSSVAAVQPFLTTTFRLGS